jgi:tetratricopeptide (TPR) repeat protein
MTTNAEFAVELQEQAWSLQAEGKLEEAAAAVGKALLLLEESGEANSPDAANLLNDLAEIENERQNFQDALVLAQRADSIEEQLGDFFAGEEAAQIRARTMGLIGEICRMRGDLVRAELSLKEALRIVSAEFGEPSERSQGEEQSRRSLQGLRSVRRGVALVPTGAGFGHEMVRRRLPGQ